LGAGAATAENVAPKVANAGYNGAVPLPIPFVLGAAAIAAGGTYAAVREHRRYKHRLATWAQTAADMGATYWPPDRSLFRNRSERIVADLGDARVVLDLYVQSTGKTTITYSQVRASVPLGVAPRFRVYREGLAASIGKALGMGDAILGHDRFDETFMVRCEDDDRVRAMWTHHAMELAAGYFAKAEIVCDGSLIRLRQVGAFDDSERIRAGLELVAELASFDFYGRAALREVGGAGYRETGGPWDERTRPEAHLELPSRVVIGPERVQGTLCTVARLIPEVRVEDIVVRAGESSEHWHKLPSVCGPYRNRVGAGVLRVREGGATFLWDHIESEADHLRQAAELLAALVVSDAGAYR